MSILDYVKRSNELKNELPLQPFQRRADEMGLPTTATFELTPRCNFSCNMCYMRTDYSNSALKELSTNEWLSLAKQTAEYGVLHLLLTGGEVFLRDDFQYLYESMYDMGFLISIFTNASLITEDTIGWLAKRKPTSVSISIYGTSENTYSKLCHNASGYTNTFRGIELLEEAGIKFLVKSLRVNENEDDIDEIARISKEKGWRYIHSDIVENPRTDTNRLIVDYETDDILRQLDEQLKDDMFRNIIDELHENKKRIQGELYKSKGFFCSAGKSRFWITWYGMMQGCASLTCPRTSPLTKGVMHAWEELRDEVNKLQSPIECLECDFFEICRRCPATHYIDTKEYGKVSKRICVACKSKLLQRQNIMKEDDPCE